MDLTVFYQNMWIPFILASLFLFFFILKYRKFFFENNDHKKDLPNLAQTPFKSYKVKFVMDGDSVQVWDGNEKHEVRLYGIDCPEYDQEWGETAKAGLIKLIGGRDVYLEEFGVDGYGRLLATVYVKSDGELINVNEKMVVKGHAWVMRRFFKKLSRGRQVQLNRLESWAKEKRVGLWASDNPCPPWEWRKRE